MALYTNSGSIVNFGSKKMLCDVMVRCSVSEVWVGMNVYGVFFVMIYCGLQLKRTKHSAKPKVIGFHDLNISEEKRITN